MAKLNQVTANPEAGRGHDQNGNMTSSGLTGYGYDDENQLTVAAYVSGDWTSGWRTEFTYDGKMRLRRQADYYWTQITPGTTNGYWTISNDQRFVYDGMLVVQERNSANVPRVTYTRGPDLSGTLQGAGGIGGMLGRSHGYSTTTGAWSSHYHYHADGNGNITYMVSPIESLGASYKYDPFGNLISSSGPGSSANLYRFSSKMWTGNSALYYYGYRFYNPGLQRWMNRDPLGDVSSLFLVLFGVPPEGAIRLAMSEGPNPYWALRNSPPVFIDSNGLACGSDNGPPLGRDSIIPDNPFDFEFGGACDNHDQCYGRCGSNKAACDGKFYNEMKEKCDSYRPALANPSFCYLLAEVYYQAVHQKGGEAYRTGQNEACKCEEKANNPIQNGF